MRIMSFADYKLDRHSPVNYDRDLISPLLVVSWLKGEMPGNRETGKYMEVPRLSWLCGKRVI